MAADKRQKRLSNSSTISSWEQGKARREKLGLLKHDLNVRSTIALEWDDKNRSVVARREQIGLAWRDLIPFVDYGPHSHNILTDVLAIPSEIFDLETLKEVLSYEAWRTHLSENERNYLLQFLPDGAQTHQVVKELLAGDNFHFGNPLLKWGASLCSGNLHPDVILHQEQCFKARKNSYYSELQKYHNDMIGGLLMLKERWATCKDFAKEVGNKIWRFHDAEVDLETLSESCSWAVDGEADNRYKQNLIMKHREPCKRKSFMEDNCDTLSAGLNIVAIPRRGEKLHNPDVHGDDGFKYMSYIKASRQPHQRGKSNMKEFGNSSPSRSLNRALVNLDTFHVQMFLEEGWKKLHQHWVQLATRDLPLACENWRMLQLRKRQLARSLKQDMEEKLNSFNEILVSKAILSRLHNANLVVSKMGEQDRVEDCSHVMLPDLKNRASASGATSMRTPKVECEGLLVEHVNNREENHRSTIELSEDRQAGDHATAKPDEIPSRESSSEYGQSLSCNRVMVALNRRSASQSYGNIDRSMSLIDSWPNEQGHGQNELLLPLQKGALLSFMR